MKNTNKGITILLYTPRVYNPQKKYQWGTDNIGYLSETTSDKDIKVFEGDIVSLNQKLYEVVLTDRFNMNKKEDVEKLNRKLYNNSSFNAEDLHEKDEDIRVIVLHPIDEEESMPIKETGVAHAFDLI